LGVLLGHHSRCLPCWSHYPNFWDKVSFPSSALVAKGRRGDAIAAPNQNTNERKNMKNTKQTKQKKKINKLDIRKIYKALRVRLEDNGISKEWMKRHLIVI
jgi:3-oxoacyl-[acyl-carrier-protein] synthase III